MTKSDNDNDNDDNLPGVPKELQNLSYPSLELDANSSLEDHLNVSAVHLNNAIKATYTAWSMVRTPLQIAKLALTTAELVKKQRELLLKPVNLTEYIATKQNKTFGYEDI